MSFALDASIAAGWFLPSQESAATAAIGRRLGDAPARAPDLFWHEVRNLLVIACRRGRLPEDLLLLHLSKLEKLAIRNAGPGDSIQIAQLALRHGLTAYDAAYLALAKSEHLPLATLDKALRRAAAAEGITLLPAEGV